MVIMYPATIEFGWAAPRVTADDKPSSVQNEELRGIALDSLVRVLDDLSGRASRAATTLRKLRPMLPAGKR
jgi:hypothetical protein